MYCFHKVEQVPRIVAGWYSTLKLSILSSRTKSKDSFGTTLVIVWGHLVYICGPQPPNVTAIVLLAQRCQGC